MYKLPFLDLGYDHAPIRNFWSLHKHDIPKLPGVYILIAKPGIVFMYPRRQSSVFYIGQTRNLYRRLHQHLRYSEEAKYQRKETLYYPRYEYASSFAGRYTYLVTKPREKPKRLEDDVLACFAEHYRSWPVANSIGSWESLLKFKEWEKRHRVS